MKIEAWVVPMGWAFRLPTTNEGFYYVVDDVDMPLVYAERIRAEEYKVPISLDKLPTKVKDAILVYMGILFEAKADSKFHNTYTRVLRDL